MKKKYFFTMTLLSMFFSVIAQENKKVNTGCGMASTYAEMAFMSFKKAYQAGSLDDAKVLLKDAVGKAKEASAYSIIPDCNCANAKNYSLNAVIFGNKALKAADLDNLKKWAKKAMDMSLDVMTAIPNCK
ncbi:hypothetical protein [Sphingobacterium sp. UME9]|uniref:hypothetical protein n=1 Tax=Sphingobacterium sp. UME9 TaxID=1862316 RepID=UPI002180D4AA|nr:hypothetical protein [Sphingobacterium sp. UME9]